MSLSGERLENADPQRRRRETMEAETGGRATGQGSQGHPEVGTPTCNNL